MVPRQLRGMVGTVLTVVDVAQIGGCSCVGAGLIGAVEEILVGRAPLIVQARPRRGGQGVKTFASTVRPMTSSSSGGVLQSPALLLPKLNIVQKRRRRR